MDVRTCYKLRLEDLAEANYRKRTINNIDADFADSLLLNREITLEHPDVTFYKVGQGSPETTEAEFRVIAGEAENTNSDRMQIGVDLGYGVFALLNLYLDDEVLYYNEDDTHILYYKGIFISNKAIFEKTKLNFKKLKFDFDPDAVCVTEAIWLANLGDIAQIMQGDGEVELTYHIDPDNTMLVVEEDNLLSGNFVWRLPRKVVLDEPTSYNIVSRQGCELGVNKEENDA